MTRTALRIALPLAAVGLMHNLIALILKIEPQQRGNILIIFHQQNGFGH